MISEREKIEVLYAMMDKKGNYSKYAGTSICSMFENTREKVRVHILHDGSIKGENKKNFEIMAKKYQQEIIFYNVRKLLPEVLRKANDIMEKALKDDRYTEAALYRLLAPQILPETVERLIYLDTDTLVNLDIKKLWEEDIGSSAMGVVYEGDMLAYYKVHYHEAKEEMKKLRSYFETLGVKLNDGFNSGVLLMDLNKIRPMGNLLLSGLEVMAGSNTKNNYYDQNILNFYFGEKAFRLPWYYNFILHLDKRKKGSREVEGIYHYMGRSLRMDPDDLRDTVFFDYFVKTPWMKGDIICRMFGDLENIYLRYMEKRFALMRKIAANLAVKKLVLAVSSKKEQAVAKLLQKPEMFEFKTTYPMEMTAPLFIKDPKEDKKKEKSERRNINRPYLLDNVTYLFLGDDENLNLNLTYDVGAYYYLFFVEDYVKLKVLLEQAGLEEEGHYMNGDFLIEEIIEGGVMNPSKFVDNL